jgi:mannosylglycoprotein endo-beta-mannosidase
MDFFLQEIAADKAPGPNGFIGLFLKKAWGIVKQDLLQAFQYFFQQHDQHLKLLSTAHFVLLPKKHDARDVQDYRPISLTHSIAKLISKCLASRLAPELDKLVSRTQSAFIKKRNIQDNFLFAQNLIRSIHRSKQQGLFLKLDIAKAFDSVRWDFLMEVMQQFGFGAKWRNWVSILLSSSSSSVILNGSRGPWFRHFDGLRQGDSLSPMLFILAMEPLQKMLAVAASDGLLSPLSSRGSSIHVSLYADDAVVFVKPIITEIQVIANILDIFGHALGLNTNRDKCAAYPIHCDGLNLDEIMVPFSCQVHNFPCTYLGLPLHVRQLSKVQVQPLIDKMANRLPLWKGRFPKKAARVKLVNSVLSSMPTYFLTIFSVKKWAFKKMDKIRRSFFWKGIESVNGGHCLVRWEKVKRPKNVGELGVLDLERFSRALRLRWLWFEWTESDRPWVGTEVPCSEVDHQLFRASTVVTLGNGTQERFWNSSWLEVMAPRDMAPNLFKLAWRKNRTAAEELTNHHWTRGLWRMSTADEIAEFILLWDKLQHIQLTDETDSITWRWTAHGNYTSKSAYSVQFRGTYCSFDTKAIWKASAEGKHKLFAWLLVQNRILTADLLLVRNWLCQPVCILCDQNWETTVHLCLHCVYAREVWFMVSNWAEVTIQVPAQDVSTKVWWNGAMQERSKSLARRAAAILMCTGWNLWKERNRRIFSGTILNAGKGCSS